MKASDPVRVRRLGYASRRSHAETQWIEGKVLMASGNDESLALAFDEGIPLLDAGFLPGVWTQVLILLWSEEHGCYKTLHNNAPYEVEVQAPAPAP